MDLLLGPSWLCSFRFLQNTNSVTTHTAKGPSSSTPSAESCLATGGAKPGAAAVGPDVACDVIEHGAAVWAVRKKKDTCISFLILVGCVWTERSHTVRCTGVRMHGEVEGAAQERITPSCLLVRANTKHCLTAQGKVKNNKKREGSRERRK